MGKESPEKMEVTTLGGGCFWCTEAVFSEIKGVVKVNPGYSGGSLANPTYEQVSTGKTGHAEVVQIIFDPHIISFREILQVFFATHDPTTLNRQGADVGTQYRSAVFYHDREQKATVEKFIEELNIKKSIQCTNCDESRAVQSLLQDGGLSQRLLQKTSQTVLL